MMTDVDGVGFQHGRLEIESISKTAFYPRDPPTVASDKISKRIPCSLVNAYNIRRSECHSFARAAIISMSISIIFPRFYLSSSASA